MNIIEMARIKKGFSQSELARRCKLAPSYISKIESNKRLPSNDSIVILSKTLDICPVETFIALYLHDQCKLIKDKVILCTYSDCKECFIKK